MSLYSLCQDLGQLPRAGGVLDQDAYLMQAFGFIINHKSTRMANEKSNTPKG